MNIFGLIGSAPFFLLVPQPTEEEGHPPFPAGASPFLWECADRVSCPLLIPPNPGTRPASPLSPLHVCVYVCACVSVSVCGGHTLLCEVWFFERENSARKNSCHGLLDLELLLRLPLHRLLPGNGMLSSGGLCVSPFLPDASRRAGIYQPLSACWLCSTYCIYFSAGLMSRVLFSVLFHRQGNQGTEKLNNLLKVTR